MTDSFSALLGIVIVIVIGLVVWRLGRQARRQSEGAYASDAPEKGVAQGQSGMSVTDQTLFAQHTSTRTTWNVTSHGGDGPA
jgi:hypothetical protein